MRRHILYVASSKQAELTRASLNGLSAVKQKDQGAIGTGYLIHYKQFENLEIFLNVVDTLDAITPHLKLNPVDLLIYDERQGIDAIDAINKISKDVKDFAELWGPDFLFPMRRAVTIINDDGNAANKSFILGRDHVRDVLVNPNSFIATLRWIAKILIADFKLSTNKKGLALSGGGMEGFLYQLGTVLAFQNAIKNFKANDFNLFSGVSSGSIVASLMAAGVPTIEIVRAIHSKSEILPPLTNSTVFDFATKDIAKRIGKQSISWAGIDPSKWIQKTFHSIPTGLFKGEKLKDYFRQSMEAFGNDDQFSSLNSELYIGATDQDTYEHIVFGEPGWDDVPISDAVRASCALPPFFTPAQIKGRWFIDGQITKTCNLELSVKKGCRLIIIIDPLKPYPLLSPGSADKKGGVYALIQTVKALVYTRFNITLSHLTERYPDIDFMVFQPDEECAKLMVGSPMRYKLRTKIIDLSYLGTLRKLRERHTVYSEKFAKFDLKLASQDELSDLERIGIEL
ncbi:MAG: patatin-like phospholipase family protein [Bdellovibrionota bacterium]